MHLSLFKPQKLTQLLVWTIFKLMIYFLFVIITYDLPIVLEFYAGVKKFGAWQPSNLACVLLLPENLLKQSDCQ